MNVALGVFVVSTLVLIGTVGFTDPRPVTEAVVKVSAAAAVLALVAAAVLSPGNTGGWE